MLQTPTNPHGRDMFAVAVKHYSEVFVQLFCTGTSVHGTELFSGNHGLPVEKHKCVF